MTEFNFIRSFLLCTTFLLCVRPMLAQSGELRVRFDRNERNEYQFYAENNSNDWKHVIVQFSQLDYLAANTKMPFQKNVPPGRSPLFKLKPVGAGDPRFDYSSTYYNGVANPEIQDVLYVFPVLDDKPHQVRRMTKLKEAGQQTNQQESMTMMSIKTEEGDTIRAARGGMIVKVVNESQKGGQAEYTYTRDRNEIRIRHKDGTVASYTVFENNSSFVEEGDFVNAGDPIAIASSGEEYRTGSHTRFQVYYLLVDVQKGFSSKDWSKTELYVPRFYTKESNEGKLKSGNSYTGVLSEELIMQEMSKREKKKYLKSKSQ